MAYKNQNTSGVNTHSYTKDVNKDTGDIYMNPASWSHARNAINNSKTGDLGMLGNEPANLHCVDAPHQIIGAIHLVADNWAVFSTNGTTHDIGIYQEDTCKYFPAVTDTLCLNFSADHLIKGVSKSTTDCLYEVYWDDGNNPSRFIPLNVINPLVNPWTDPNSPIPWIQVPAPGPAGLSPCFETVNTAQVDCQKLRVANLITAPCIVLNKGVSGGAILNGSYLVAIAYAVREVKVSNYYISNIQSVFDHDNSVSSLDVELSNVDIRYEEMIVVLISIVNGQTVARQAGFYSTRQTRLSFDVIQPTWPAVPIEQIPIMNPVDDKSDAMYSVGNYLIRVGPTSKFDFNYQPFANQIVTKWQSVEYPLEYYRNGGHNTNYLRDEVYPFFVEWLYDTGDKSASYHIPGRPKTAADAGPPTAGDTFPGDTQLWQTTNTATFLSTPGTILPDGGVVIAEGFMGYWESSEAYPTNDSIVWDANIATSPYSPALANIIGGAAAHNLCGSVIRHHKFPEETIMNLSNSNPLPFTETNLYNPGNNKIRIMGVAFENVLPPRDNAGNLIPGIIGYNILRGTRNGNKTIIAKGMINNMIGYDADGTNKPSLFPNYPYNDLRDDPFLSLIPSSRQSTQFQNGAPPEIFTTYPTAAKRSQSDVTFHSPDTSFNRPFLGAKELKIYGQIHGNSVGKFDISEKHPKEKLITDTTFLLGAIVGVGLSNLAINGQRRLTQNSPKWRGFSQDGVQVYRPGSLTTLAWSAPYGVGAVNSTNIGGSLVSLTGSNGAQPKAAAGSIAAANAATINTAANTYQNSYATNALIYNILGQGMGSTADVSRAAMNTAFNTMVNTNKGYSTSSRDTEQDDGQYNRINGVARTFAAIPMFMHYFTEGADNAMELLKALIRYENFALRYHSHCWYNGYTASSAGMRRRQINSALYIGPQITEWTGNRRINNLYRSNTVAVNVTTPIADPNALGGDQTRVLASQVFTPGFLKDPTKSEVSNANAIGSSMLAVSHYAAIKQRIVNQYGQLTNIIQVPVSTCYIPYSVTASKTGTLFGGDTYVGRYTEKNTFFYFYDWLYGQPDGMQLNYNEHKMIPFPRFWANFNGFQTSDFTTSFFPSLVSFGSTGLTLPSSFYNLDGGGQWLSTQVGGSFGLSMSSVTGFRFSMKESWFYLFNSGVRDFFVESEINVDQRDWGETDTEKFYDPYRYTDTKAIFDTAIIKAGNFYKYDQSLSTAKLFTNYTSWARTQSRSYNPYIAETCYVYRPLRVTYSLPGIGLGVGWRIFLANNFYDFMNRVTNIKPVNKSGAMIFFDAASPVQFQGTDQLQTSLGTKLTIGDGGLFSQPLQSVVNADAPYEYGSCQDRLSVINTPAGLFWMSQNQGKIFQMGSGLKDITLSGLKWWFAAYLPYKLTTLFPAFENTDNPVVGIGCQSIYDSENQLLYFCKKDYILTPGYTANQTPPGVSPATGPGNLQYWGGNKFKNLSTGQIITLGDPMYFEDASWTASYDPKSEGWIGFHDWHPELLIAGKNTFMSTKTDATGKGGIWIHNKRCDLYCNYYDVNYPFELEYMTNTPQQVNTLRSIEYYMEVYRYGANCYDRFHVLDYNFDEAVVYNTEQCSGLLRLNNNPRPDPVAMLTYPIINPTFIDILYSKVENKYRFNQFWDITEDRGEYPLYPALPGAQRVIWNTGANGYVKLLNPFNLAYNKAEFQRKKFRHYTNSVFLRKRVIVGQQMNYKMLVMLTNNKQLMSPR